MKWFKKRPDEVLTWSVQFEEGGRTYAYRQTRTAFAALMEERLALGREMPHSVQVIVNDQVVNVQVGT